MRTPTRNRLLAAIVALLFGAVAITVTATVALDENGNPKPTLTVKIGKRANPVAPEVVIDPGRQLGPLEQRQDADPTPIDEGPGIHEDLKDESPPGAPADAAKEIRTFPTRGIGEPLPVGGAQNYSCPRRLVRNYSARAAGSTVKAFVLHYTVSRPGSLDVIRGLFDRPDFGASSNLGLEPSGRCELWVPFDQKAWTQGPFNSSAESVEIMALGTEPRSWWLAQPILSKGILAAIVADRLRARGLPPRRVDPSGCSIAEAGWTDHNALECGMTHHDVSPGFPYDVFAAQVKRAYYGGNPIPIACTDRNVEKVLARRYPKLRIVVDGELGDRARQAVRRFQRAQKLKVDGIVGPATGVRLGLEGC